jgi:two-component system CheB/CheR fusion protein
MHAIPVLYLNMIIYACSDEVLEGCFMPRKNNVKGGAEQGQGKGVSKKLESKTAAKPSGAEVFPIVGIGASAGGLEAFTDFLKNLPLDAGMAFVFIQHLAAGQESLLTDILSRSTPLPVHKVKNNMKIERNNVYVIPPDASMTITNHTLKLQPLMLKPHRPVDQFFISLAKEAKNRAIGIVLSGTGSDGTEGLKAIYAEGGITFAQDERFSQVPGHAT